MAQRTVGIVDSQGGLRWSTSSGNVAAHRVPPPTTGRWWPCRCRCPSGCWISVRMVCCWLARPLCASARQCGSYPGLAGRRLEVELCVRHVSSRRGEGVGGCVVGGSFPPFDPTARQIISRATRRERTLHRRRTGSLGCTRPIKDPDTWRRPARASCSAAGTGSAGPRRPGSPRHRSASSEIARRRGRSGVGLHGGCHRQPGEVWAVMPRATARVARGEQTGGFRVRDVRT